ncbi:MAG: hypothetical protein R3B84_13105 [Zavarzinella sp.]
MGELFDSKLPKVYKSRPVRNIPVRGKRGTGFQPVLEEDQRQDAAATGDVKSGTGFQPV